MEALVPAVEEMMMVVVVAVVAVAAVVAVEEVAVQHAHPWIPLSSM